MRYFIAFYCGAKDIGFISLKHDCFPPHEYLEPALCKVAGSEVVLTNILEITEADYISFNSKS